MQLRVLFIDDQPYSVKDAVDGIQGNLRSVTEVVDFDKGQDRLRDFEPHVVVLDIVKSGAEGQAEPVGRQTLDFVWNEHFCPLIVYSAFSAQFRDDVPDSPFVKLVNKGAGSDEAILARIKEFNPHIEALDEVAREIRVVVNRALRYVAPRILAEVSEPQALREVLVRSARRQVAAAMDEALSSSPSGPGLRPWEHYLCPAWGKQLLTGDIIQASSRVATDPAAFSVVLTPSCDLVQGGKRKPKVSHVLVADCRPVDEFLREIKVSPRPKDKDRHLESLVSVLNQGYGRSHLPLAALRGTFPSMAADFRALRLIEISNIGEGPPAEYRRVASVDHPFRELVSWAYMHVAARPGLPDRDSRSWAEEIFSAVSSEATEPEKDASN